MRTALRIRTNPFPCLRGSIAMKGRAPGSEQRRGLAVGKLRVGRVFGAGEDHLRLPTLRIGGACRAIPECPPCHQSAPRLTYNHMVVRRKLSDAELDRLFRALADATRRDIIARLLAGKPTSVSALAARYDMSFAAVQKHVAVLEEAGLVSKHPQGRERLVHGNPERVARARELLAQLEGLWRARFSRLDTLFEPSNPE